MISLERDKSMEFKIEDCAGKDTDYIFDKLTEYNLSQVPKTQQTDYVHIRKKVADENGRIIAGCVARMYC